MHVAPLRLSQSLHTTACLLILMHGLHHAAGIGPTAAGLCVFDVMSKCGDLAHDIFFSGTSGWSPQLGGILNNGSCSSPNTNGLITRCGHATCLTVATNMQNPLMNSPADCCCACALAAA